MSGRLALGDARPTISGALQRPKKGLGSETGLLSPSEGFSCLEKSRFVVRVRVQLPSCYCQSPPRPPGRPFSRSPHGFDVCTAQWPVSRHKDKGQPCQCDFLPLPSPQGHPSWPSRGHSTKTSPQRHPAWP